MNLRVPLFVLAVLTAAISSQAASKVRLIYGKSWDRAGQQVCKTLKSSAFKTAAKGRYIVECFDEEDKAAPENLGSIALPVIFVLDEKDHCYCVIENVPYNVTAERLLAKIMSVDARRQAIEKGGMETADACGELLKAMERFVGGPRRVIDKNFYGDVFERLKKLDPSDSSGWQRHFLMGDGLDLVTKANEYREKKDFDGGGAFVESERKKPAKRLTLEQKQAILMMRFALWREDESKRPEMLKLLRRIAEAGEETFWGTAALGWLNTLGEPPLSVYWGWHQGDFKPPRFETVIRYGVSHAFSKPGDYAIDFEPSGASPVEISEVVLKAGDEEVAVIRKKPFACKVPKEQAGRIDSMTVRGTCAADTSGKISIERQILRPRKQAK